MYICTYVWLVFVAAVGILPKTKGRQQVKAESCGTGGDLLESPAITTTTTTSID